MLQIRQGVHIGLDVPMSVTRPKLGYHKNITKTPFGRYQKKCIKAHQNRLELQVQGNPKRCLKIVDSLMRLEVSVVITSLTCWKTEHFNMFLLDKIDAVEAVQNLIVK